nr:MAG TPA: hypothetical protein [Caudoviricetes sp.]
MQLYLTHGQGLQTNKLTLLFPPSRLNFQIKRANFLIVRFKSNFSIANNASGGYFKFSIFCFCNGNFIFIKIKRDIFIITIDSIIIRSKDIYYRIAY